jgi:hypothetical protein
MNVWNVSVAYKQQGWDVDLSQPRQFGTFHQDPPSA